MLLRSKPQVRFFQIFGKILNNRNKQLYVGKLPNSLNSADLEDMFSKYGRLVQVELKPGGFGFVEFEDPRDAEDAIYALDNRLIEGQRILVEFSKASKTLQTRTQNDGDENYSSHNNPSHLQNSQGNCFLCGSAEHWAKDCPDNKEKGADIRSGKCFSCGEVGHLSRYCQVGKEKLGDSKDGQKIIPNSISAGACCFNCRQPGHIAKYCREGCFRGDRGRAINRSSEHYRRFDYSRSRSRSPFHSRARERYISPVRGQRSISPFNDSGYGRKSPHNERRISPPPFRNTGDRSPVYNRHRSPYYDRRSPLLARGRSPLYERTRTPLYDRSRSPMFERPTRSPFYGRSRSPVYERRRSPLYDRPRSPLYDRPRSPIFSRPRSPFFDKPVSPLFEKRSLRDMSYPRDYSKLREDFSRNY
ncbi:hypothetical protein HK099_001577 [Clydaea vesicula]|uniref:Uncharacterized protein n=1 Tax=Clydaea vesicula TaxID=447962 RepID=A0AAD5U6K8_9FUNG|nr:hypothetical protein HK099_001577 [Clydaea vesicula]